MRIIRAVLSASRPISWVNTAFPYGLAYLLAGGGLDWLFWVGVVFFLIPYNIALYGINDVFDYESDIRNPRKGGVEGAVLPKEMHPVLLHASVWTTLPFLIVLYAAGTWASALWLTVSVFAVIAYSAAGLRFKERPVLDSVTSSAHFTTPAIVGATISVGEVPDFFWFAAGAFFLWGMASHALGAVQDVKADREGGLSSIATAFGARATTRLAAVAYLGAALLVFALPSPAWIVGIAGLGYVANTLRFWNITDETCEDVNRAWKVFLWLNYLVGAIVTISLVSVFLD
ncbi:prenyltransferase [Corynebacterium halotolerans]|uniref:Prenyltransferase n=1 Tax=Corynebacterium halotolerans YIM 70093 = DSM 44683 TaxID=1121362 RepID=M1NJY5_9CORY|nr:prenyltransferase [Corynebacterium halotolerans]AGF71718.1 prenyltransferase [Corynebacterium halotolerans YIM 70093 = DSM 44683]